MSIFNQSEVPNPVSSKLLRKILFIGSGSVSNIFEGQQTSSVYQCCFQWEFSSKINKICYIETRGNNFTKIKILGSDKKPFQRIFHKSWKLFFWILAKKVASYQIWQKMQFGKMFLFDCFFGWRSLWSTKNDGFRILLVQSN